MEIKESINKQNENIIRVGDLSSGSAFFYDGEGLNIPHGLYIKVEPGVLAYKLDTKKVSFACNLSTGRLYDVNNNFMVQNVNSEVSFTRLYNHE